MKLGVDIYSLRYQDWDAFEHLGYAHDIGLDVVHFSDLETLESLEPDYLRQVKARADELGLALEAGMGSICESSASFHRERGPAAEQMREMLEIAQILGSPVLRCLLGSRADRRSQTPLATHIENALAACRAVREQALDLGIVLAIENHAGDLQGREVRALIEVAGPEYVGACIDPGNAIWVAEDPMVTLEYLEPYVVASHVRDSAVWPHPRGAAFQWVAMGDGNVGIEAWIRRYMQQCQGAYFSMEIITGGPPRVLPYLEPAYWEAFPDTPAWEFARFEALVRQGEPFLGPMITASEPMPPEYRAALAVQQRTDLERSVAYCKGLGLGER
ncbi:MAG: sugar phosphate isomerase/epimerase [Anaerolineae bacterium]|nr:sugar phosphate isomerase/epimerase [Anaerolineae bacterium]